MNKLQVYSFKTLYNCNLLCIETISFSIRTLSQKFKSEKYILFYNNPKFKIGLKILWAYLMLTQKGIRHNCNGVWFSKKNKIVMMCVPYGLNHWKSFTVTLSFQGIIPPVPIQSLSPSMLNEKGSNSCKMIINFFFFFKCSKIITLGLSLCYVTHSLTFHFSKILNLCPSINSLSCLKWIGAFILIYYLIISDVVKFFFFWDSFNLWRSLLMIVFYH